MYTFNTYIIWLVLSTPQKRSYTRMTLELRSRETLAFGPYICPAVSFQLTRGMSVKCLPSPNCSEFLRRLFPFDIKSVCGSTQLVWRRRNTPNRALNFPNKVNDRGTGIVAASLIQCILRHILIFHH